MMTTTNQIAEQFETLIPAEVRDKFAHLSYEEMAAQPECAAWADDLLALADAWREADA